MIECPCIMMVGKQRAVIDLADIYMVMERPGGKSCDIYTSIFPEGLTVDHELESIMTTIEEIADGKNGDDSNECSADNSGSECAGAGG